MLVWRLRIFSPTAIGFKAIFDQFKLPKSGSLFFYTPDKSRMYGAFTAFNNEDHLKFGTAIIPSGEMIIEYNVLDYELSLTLMRIDKIVHVFTNGAQIGDAATCQHDVTCYPWAINWCNEIRSVVKFDYEVELEGGESQWRFCSGALINNTNNNFDPFILTARHCSGELPELTLINRDTWIVYYNFQTPDCNVDNGNDLMTTVGVEIVTYSGEAEHDINDCPDLGIIPRQI